MTTAKITKKLSDDLATARQNAGEIVNAAAEKAKENVNKIRSGLDGTLQSTKAAAQRVQTQAVSTAKATDQCIRAHPYQTIGVFFGLGILTGLLLRRR